MENFLNLINLVLFIYMILVLIKPKKFMHFINTGDAKRRIIAVATWVVVAAIITPKHNTNVSTNQEDELKDTIENLNTKRLQSAKGDSADIAKGDVFDIPKDATIDDIGLKVGLYMAYTVETDTIQDPTLKALKEHNSKAAKKLWRVKSPQLRKQYAAAIKEKLWEKDIEVKTTNEGKDIWFIGAIFAAHKNIKDFEAQIEEYLKALGFHRAYYKWVDTEYAESTYYDLN